MKNAKRRVSVASLLVAGLGVLGGMPDAAAVLFFSESFAYPKRRDARLAQSNWVGDSFLSVMEPGLIYPGLQFAGNKLGTPNAYRREMYSSLGPLPATGTYWLSFLVKLESARAHAVGLSLFEGETERAFFGSGAAGTAWGNFNGTGQFTGVVPTSDAVTLVVVRLNMTAGRSHMWVNPNLRVGEPPLTSAVNGPAGTAFVPYEITRLRVGAFSHVHSGGNGEFDEIRLATTAADLGFSAPAVRFRTPLKVRLKSRITSKASTFRIPSRRIITPAGARVQLTQGRRTTLLRLKSRWAATVELRPGRNRLRFVARLKGWDDSVPVRVTVTRRARR